MQIVIDIPEDVYTRLFDNGRPMDFADGIVMDRVIRSGTPLDKHDEEVIAETVESIWGKPPYRDVLDKIKAEIETKYGQCDICEYFEDYDYEENDISEYRPVGNITDILQIIDKYRGE